APVQPACRTRTNASRCDQQESGATGPKRRQEQTPQAVHFLAVRFATVTCTGAASCVHAGARRGLAVSVAPAPALASAGVVYRARSTGRRLHNFATRHGLPCQVTSAP